MRVLAEYRDEYPRLTGFIGNLAGRLQADTATFATFVKYAEQPEDAVVRALTVGTSDPWIAFEEIGAGRDPRGMFTVDRPNTIVIARDLARKLESRLDDVTSQRDAETVLLRGLLQWLADIEWTDSDCEPGLQFEMEVYSPPARPEVRPDVPDTAPVDWANASTTQKMRAVYVAFRTAGCTDAGARALLAEVGRENDFQVRYLFGTHLDPANRAQNAGMFSWQKERAVELLRYLGSKGLVDSDGRIQRSQASLNAQAEFACAEMKKMVPETLKYLTDPQQDVDYEEAARLLGTGYIKWRFNDPRYAHHHVRRRSYLERSFEKINPDDFIVGDRAGDDATGSPGSGAATAALENFNDGPIPMSLLGGRRDLVLGIQQALTRLGYLDPPADGKFGPTSAWAINAFCRLNGLSTAGGFTKEIANALRVPAKTLPDIKTTGSWFDRVVEYMGRKGYWICRHPDCKNIVYLEGVSPDGSLNDDRPNEFNDLRIVFSIDDTGTPVVERWDATTEPGIFWTVHPMHPGGAARIAFDQYKSWIVGTHRPGKKSAHEALVQVESIAVHRDLNKDYKRTSDRVDRGLFGVNQHWGYDAPKDDLGSTSAGCLVGRTKDGHREFMKLLKSDPRYRANKAYRFMTAVMPGDEVLGR